MAMDGLLIGDERRLGSVSRPESRTATIRKNGSVDGDLDGGFRMRNARGTRTHGLHNGMDDERELYAEYLRSSTTRRSRDGLSRGANLSADRGKKVQEG